MSVLNGIANIQKRRYEVPDQKLAKDISPPVHLACGLGEFLHHDLDTVYLLKPFECKGGYTQDGPKFSIDGIQRGTGIEYTV